MNGLRQKPLSKGAGVLLPVASLPSNYGIGTFGEAAFDFVDFIAMAGLKYWQVLPLGPTGYGDSPYQSFSAFAGNPYFVDLDLLIEEGLLDKEDVSRIQWAESENAIDYERIYRNRFPVLKKAHGASRGQYKQEAEYKEFIDESVFWLADYALYMGIKEKYDNLEWLKWPGDIRLREQAAVEKHKEALAEEMEFWKFVQYKFSRQWQRLKEYAHEKGVWIIGDIPIYVAMDSADAWVHFQLFEMDEDHRPTMVAGVPPDLFSRTGQLWGNPLYDWEKMKRDNFFWWRKRMRHIAGLFDVIRIDHFIGISRYYCIPTDAETAENGIYKQGPGMAFILAIKEEIGESKVIAEDLGIVTKDVKKILRFSGYPGMKVLLFAFDGSLDNPNLPEHVKRNTVVYGGTHDNDTIAGFIEKVEEESLRFIKKYFHEEEKDRLPLKIMGAGLESRADVAIFQMQDYLMLGNEAKINTPATLGENWKWRLLKGQASLAVAEGIRRIIKKRGTD